MCSLRDFKKCTPQHDTQAVTNARFQRSTLQHDTQAVHTMGIIRIVPEEQISKVIDPLPYKTLIMSISKDVPHSMIPTHVGDLQDNLLVTK